DLFNFRIVKHLMSVRVWVNYSISFKLPAVFGIQYFQRTFSTITWIYYLKRHYCRSFLLFPFRGGKSNNSFSSRKIYFINTNKINYPPTHISPKRDGKGTNSFVVCKWF